MKWPATWSPTANGRARDCSEQGLPRRHPLEKLNTYPR